MNSIRRTFCFLLVGVALLPYTAYGGSHFLGDWQPHSRTAQWLGKMTLSDQALKYAQGPSADLAVVRAGGSVFRLDKATDSPAFKPCGPSPIGFIAYRILDDGKLAVLMYRGSTPPEEPSGSTASEMASNGACSIDFYTR